MQREANKETTELYKKILKPKGRMLLVEMLEPTSTCSYNGREVDYATGTVKGTLLVIPPQDLKLLQAQEATAMVYATVIAQGADCYPKEDYIEPLCKVGDTVFIAMYGGQIIRARNRDLTSLRFIFDKDVLATIDE